MTDEAAVSPMEAPAKANKRPASTSGDADCPSNPDHTKAHKRLKVTTSPISIKPEDTERTQLASHDHQACATPTISHDQPASFTAIKLATDTNVAIAATLPSCNIPAVTIQRSTAAAETPSCPHQTTASAAQMAFAAAPVSVQNHSGDSNALGDLDDGVMPAQNNNAATPEVMRSPQYQMLVASRLSADSALLQTFRAATMQRATASDDKCLQVSAMPPQSAAGMQPQGTLQPGQVCHNIQGITLQNSRSDQPPAAPSNSNTINISAFDFTHGMPSVQQLSPDQLACCVMYGPAGHDTANGRRAAARWTIPASIGQAFFTGLNLPADPSCASCRVSAMQTDGNAVPLYVGRTKTKHPGYTIAGLTSYIKRHYLQAGDLVLITRRDSAHGFAISHQFMQQTRQLGHTCSRQEDIHAFLQSRRGGYSPSRVEVIDSDHMTWSIPTNFHQCSLASCVRSSVFRDLQLPKVPGDPLCSFSLTGPQGSQVKAAIVCYGNRGRPFFKMIGLERYIRQHGLQRDDVIMIARTGPNTYSISHEKKSTIDVLPANRQTQLRTPATTAPDMTRRQDQYRPQPGSAVAATNSQNSTDQGGERQELTATPSVSLDIQDTVDHAFIEHHWAHPHTTKILAQDTITEMAPNALHSASRLHNSECWHADHQPVDIPQHQTLSSMHQGHMRMASQSLQPNHQSPGAKADYHFIKGVLQADTSTMQMAGQSPAGQAGPSVSPGEADSHHGVQQPTSARHAELNQQQQNTAHLWHSFPPDVHQVNPPYVKIEEAGELCMRPQLPAPPAMPPVACRHQYQFAQQTNLAAGHSAANPAAANPAASFSDQAAGCEGGAAYTAKQASAAHAATAQTGLGTTVHQRIMPLLQSASASAQLPSATLAQGFDTTTPPTPTVMHGQATHRNLNLTPQPNMAQSDSVAHHTPITVAQSSHAATVMPDTAAQSKPASDAKKHCLMVTPAYWTQSVPSVFPRSASAATSAAAAAGNPVMSLFTAPQACAQVNLGAVQPDLAVPGLDLLQPQSGHEQPDLAQPLDTPSITHPALNHQTFGKGQTAAPTHAQHQPQRATTNMLELHVYLPDVLGLSGIARQRALETGLDMALAALQADKKTCHAVRHAMCIMAGDVERLKAFMDYQYPCIATAYESHDVQRLQLCLKTVFNLYHL